MAWSIKNLLIHSDCINDLRRVSSSFLVHDFRLFPRYFQLFFGGNTSFFTRASSFNELKEVTQILKCSFALQTIIFENMSLIKMSFNLCENPLACPSVFVCLLSKCLGSIFWSRPVSNDAQWCGTGFSFTDLLQWHTWMALPPGTLTFTKASRQQFLVRVKAVDPFFGCVNPLTGVNSSENIISIMNLYSLGTVHLLAHHEVGGAQAIFASEMVRIGEEELGGGQRRSRWIL